MVIVHDLRRDNENGTQVFGHERDVQYVFSKSNSSDILVGWRLGVVGVHGDWATSGVVCERASRCFRASWSAFGAFLEVALFFHAFSFRTTHPGGADESIDLADGDCFLCFFLSCSCAATTTMCMSLPFSKESYAHEWVDLHHCGGEVPTSGRPRLEASRTEVDSQACLGYWADISGSSTVKIAGGVIAPRST